jgi:hypothetical protein
MTARPSTFISHSADKVINRTWHRQFHCCRSFSDRQNWNLILRPTALQTI